MAAMSLREMAAVHAGYIASLQVRGLQVLTFDAPCCGEPIETRAAPRGQQWDTLSMCHHCGALFMKITTSTKAVGLIPEVEL